MPARTRSQSWFSRTVRFYRDGLRGMTLGRSLWLVIAIKLVIIFGVLKLFFFPDFLDTRFRTDRERADFVLEQLTRPASSTHSGGAQDD